MITLASTLGFTNHFIVNPLGFVGGLLFFWKQGSINLQVISYNSQSIHTKVCRGIDICFITFAYVRPNPLSKCRFWNYCNALANSMQVPWIVLGDLNDIAANDEQWGSSSVNNSFLQTFV